MTIYYVSSQIGSSKNAGTSASAPLASLQAAANLVKPGDTVEVMNGTYTSPYYGDALHITTSGTASAPITFEAAAGQTPVIDSSGGWQGINIQASYITVKGFTVVGDAAKYSLASATAGYSTGSSDLDGSGIAINPSSSVTIPNHIIIENNTVYNEPGGGIYTEGADYVQILNNVVHNNANWSAFGNSGISVSTSANSGSSSGPHIIVSGNLSYNNAQLVPTNGAGIITDGEGIILDTNPNYTGGFLVQNNTVYGNGGPGIESNQSSNATITSNTIYGNNVKHTQAVGDGAIFVYLSANQTITNNTLSNPGVAAPSISRGVVNGDGSVTFTGTALAGSTVAVSNGGASALGTAIAGSTGAWSLTTTILAAGAYAFTATDTTSAGTSVASKALGLTVGATAANTRAPAAPTITRAAENADDSVTVTGTASANSTVKLLCNEGAVGSTTVNGAGAWSFTTHVLDPANYAFIATDTTAGGTSARSNAVSLKVERGQLNVSASTANVAAVPAFVAAPVISKAVVNSNHTVTVTGTAVANSTVNLLCNGGAVGSTTTDSHGAWSFTTHALDPANYAFIATDRTSAGTSAKSKAMALTLQPVKKPASASLASVAAPVISKAVVNSNHTVTVTGTAVANSAVNLLCNGGAVGSTTANSHGAWSFTTHALDPANYAFIATDRTSAGTSAKSKAMALTLQPVKKAASASLASVAAPVISKAVVNSNDTVTVTGTAVANSAVNLLCNGGAVGSTTANSHGAWSFTTHALDPANYAFIATDRTSAGTSAKSKAMALTLQPVKKAAGASLASVAAPVISKAVVNSNDTVTVTGTAVANSAVNLLCNGGAVGSTTANSHGAWSFTTHALDPANYAFIATDRTSAGTSAKSHALALTVKDTRTAVSSSATSQTHVESALALAAILSSVHASDGAAHAIVAKNDPAIPSLVSANSHPRIA